MTPRRLLLATRNQHKVQEISDLLSGLDIDLSSLADLGVADLPGEDDVEIYGTFEQNALAKARFYRIHTGWDVIADDSGLCVDALSGGPGVRSRRFAADHGRTGPDQDEANNDCLLDLLADAGEGDRGAHYRCAVALVSSERTLIVNGRVDGQITSARQGRGGFGYDPLFLLPARGRTFGELPAEVKAACSHRAEAIRSLRRWLDTRPMFEV
ncbi:MAG: non-canonical purine NTP pyrophosphatase [marine benthic group bacterium]|nr:non-canonical purine NTP pyrophosphatase [Candidatus Benthicola marisminoris]